MIAAQADTFVNVADSPFPVESWIGLGMNKDRPIDEKTKKIHEPNTVVII